MFQRTFSQNYKIGPRYAEIKYTQGGYEHLEMAKTYYSHAVKLNPNNMRALYGLLQVSSDI
jgi:cytochrome c-type biogenesis protein CcmH/NrfG